MAEKAKTIENYSLGNSADMMSLAEDLKRFIKEKTLFQNIQGKEYVNVEAWQYAGARLGLTPVVTSTYRLSAETDEMKYGAEVQVMEISSGKIVGSGMGICSGKENGKKYWQEFAIASMAQTRGVGKAYRNILAWLIRAAGYEPTPAEEMDSIAPAAEATATKKAETPKTSPVPAPVEPAAPAAPVENKSLKENWDVKFKNLKTAEDANKLLEIINGVDIKLQDALKRSLNVATKEAGLVYVPAEKKFASK